MGDVKAVALLLSVCAVVAVIVGVGLGLAEERRSEPPDASGTLVFEGDLTAGEGLTVEPAHADRTITLPSSFQALARAMPEGVTSVDIETIVVRDETGRRWLIDPARCQEAARSGEDCSEAWSLQGGDDAE